MSASHEFSEQGQDWIQSVLTCLQNALKPYLTSEVDCQTLEDIAFDSHEACYTQDGLSICDLPPSDWGKVIKTIYTALSKKRVVLQSVMTGLNCFPTEVKRLYLYIIDDVYQSLSDYITNKIATLANIQDNTRIVLLDLQENKRASNLITVTFSILESWNETDISSYTAFTNFDDNIILQTYWNANVTTCDYTCYNEGNY